MVSLSDVLASNEQIPSAIPKQPVAVFAGVTSGIGKVALGTFVRYAIEPRIYIFARNQQSAERVIAACRQINDRGEYTFVKVDLSSIKETDHACEIVKSKENLVNLVYLSAGEIRIGGATPEGLTTFLAASVYSRVRIAQQFLPLLSAAAASTSLARIVDVGGGTYEGKVDTNDIACRNVPFTSYRPHLSSMHTLAWETLIKQAPTVSIVHNFPGAVYTELHKDVPGVIGWFIGCALPILYAVVGRWLFIPLEETGERQMYLATSEKFKAKEGNAYGVGRGKIEVANGSDEVVGSGVYSVNYDGEKRTNASIIALRKLRKDGVREKVWDHMMGEFDRIAGDA